MQAEQMNIEIMDDEGLIVLAKEGDEQSFNKLVRMWYRRIYNYAFRQCADEFQSEEITQQTFIAVFKNLPKLKEVSSFKPWLYRIATNFCFAHGRKLSKSKSIAFSGVSESENHKMSQGEAKEVVFNPERSYQQIELENILYACLQELNEEQRSVLIMKEYEGMKFNEIAEVLKLSENTVKTRLYRGLKILKDLLDKRNITKETIYYEL